MPAIVVAGGGFAGLSAARELQRRRRSVADLDVVLVDRNNFMLFTPMLPEAASGAVDVRHIAQPFREMLPHVRFELGDVTVVDEEKRQLHARHPLTGETRAIAYDELILALGSTPSTLGIDGVERYAMTLRTAADAARIRNALIGALEVASRTSDLIERDRLLRFVIVGGGFTGVESAGELSAFVRAISRYYPLDREAEFVLLQHQDRLLPHLPAKFGKYAARSLRDRGVALMLGRKVQAIDAEGVTLDDGKRCESRTVIWDAGTQPNPIVHGLALKIGAHGAIAVCRDGAVEGHPHLWAIGDCAAVPKPGGGYYGPLAQNAVREGPLVARNALAALRGRKSKPFAHRELGQAASLGDRQALIELPAGKFATGFPAWLMWRGYYLSRVPSVAERTRVALDWTLGLAFPPSVARLTTRADRGSRDTRAAAG